MEDTRRLTRKEAITREGKEMESNIVMRINESKGKKKIKSALKLAMMAAAIFVAITMEEFKV